MSERRRSSEILSSTEDIGRRRSGSSAPFDCIAQEEQDKSATVVDGTDQQNVETARGRFVIPRRNSFENLSFRNAVVKKDSFTEDGNLKSPLSVFVEMLEKNESSISRVESNDPFSFLDDYIIDAAHPLKVWWDFLVVISIFWTLITVPYQLTFNITPKGWLRIFGITIDVIFGVDTIISFFTSYYDGSEQITSFFLIAKRYLKTWFLPDIISIFPLEYLLSSPGVSSSLGLVRIFRLFRLIKIIRIFRLQHKILNANLAGHLSKAFTSLITMIFIVFFIAHLYACGFHQFTDCNYEYALEGVVVVGEPSQRAAEFYLDSLECMHSGNYFSLYSLSLYWTFTSLLTVGYGDIVLASSSGRLYTLLVVFTGNILFGYLIAIMLEQTIDPNPLSLQNKQRMGQIKKYLLKRLISPTLTKRLMRHFDYYYPRRSLLIEPKDTIQACPIFIRKELFSILNSKIYSLTLFDSNIHLIFEMVPFLHPYLMDSNELLLAEDDYCRELYFVLSGVLNAFKQNIHTNNTKIYVGIWTAGSDLNISCAMNLKKVAWATYKSHKRTELLWMDGSALVKYRDLQNHRKTTKTTAAMIWETFLTRGEEERRQHDLLTDSMKGKSIFKLGVVDHHLPRMIFNNKIIDTSKDELKVKGYLPYHRGSRVNGSRLSNESILGTDDIHPFSPHSSSSFSSFSSEDMFSPKGGKYYLVSRPSHVLMDYDDEDGEWQGQGQGQGQGKGQEQKKGQTQAQGEEGELIQIHETSWMMLQRGIINPQSTAKIIFDLFVIFLTLLLLITIPLRYAFDLPQSTLWKIYDQIIQWVFITDCLFSFFTAFERPDFTLNTEHREIFRKYLQSWFPIDFLSAFPFEILFTQHGLSLLKLFKLLRIIRITRVFKVLKISRILKLFKFSSSKQTQSISDSAFSVLEDITLRLLSGLMVVGYVVHLLSCGWYYLSLHSGSSGDADGRYSWHNRNPDLGGGGGVDVVASDRISLYISSLYFVSATSASVGYGDIIATTDAERLYAILIMLVGTILVSFVVAQVVHTESLSHSALPYSSSTFQDIDMIRHYLTEQAISKTQTHSVLKHFYFLTEVRTEFDEEDIWRRIPFKYRTFLITHSYHKIIHQFPVLFHPSLSSFSSVLLTYLQPCYCVSKSYLLDYETGYDGFYLLHTGAVEIIDEDHNGSEILLGNIHPGKIFGESNIFPDTHPPPPPAAAAAAATAAAALSSATAHPQPDPSSSAASNRSHSISEPVQIREPELTPLPSRSSSELPFLGIRALVDCQLYHLSLCNANLFLSHHPLIAPEIIAQLRTISQATLETAISDYSVIRNSIRLKAFQGSHGRRPSLEALNPSASASGGAGGGGASTGSDIDANNNSTASPSSCVQISLRWIQGTLNWFFDSDDELSAIRYNYLNTAHETMKSYTEKEIEAILNALKNKSPSMILSTNGREKFLAMKKSQDLNRLRDARDDRGGGNRRRRKRSLTAVVPLPDRANGNGNGNVGRGEGGGEGMEQSQEGNSNGKEEERGLSLSASVDKDRQQRMGIAKGDNLLESIEEP